MDRTVLLDGVRRVGDRKSCRQAERALEAFRQSAVERRRWLEHLAGPCGKTGKARGEVFVFEIVENGRSRVDGADVEAADARDGNGDQRERGSRADPRHCSLRPSMKSVPRPASPSCSSPLKAMEI